jgi:hypothetical protein
VSRGGQETSVRLPTTPALIGPLLGGLLVVGATAAPAEASHAPLPPGRDLRTHVVQPGETATELAVRYHAWTAELVAHNHLGPSAALHTGQRIVIPVVRSAVPNRERSGGRPAEGQDTGPVADPSRARVHDRIAQVSRRRGVDPELSLAVSWQEAGWQMHHVSDAGAIGAMQVLPSTARWMEYYVGRSLRPRRLHDNAVTGVTLLRVLADNTRTQRHRVGAYYQGLGAVRDHGLYGETRAYVDNVLAIKRRLEQGRPPA